MRHGVSIIFKYNGGYIHQKLLLLVALPSNVKNHQSVGGIVVSMAAFQAVDPGSIPGQHKLFSFFCFLTPFESGDGYIEVRVEPP